MSLTPNQLKAQSQSAYNQWSKQWREHAKHHSKYVMNPLSDFEHVGVGKAVLCAANGYSLELEMETIKANQGKVDILACDKSLGNLLRNGVKPTYVVVCDANVDYEKYLEPWKDQLQDTILFINVCANPKWADNGNWKDKYFFVLEDVLQSEKEFCELSGCPNVVVAGTNVSNAQVVLLTQSDNNGRRNFFGYDKILLVGFDYCWREDGNYYAYDKDGGGKANYMRQIYTRNINNDQVFTSTNLAVSAKWLDQYISTFKLPVVQCSGESVLAPKNRGVLSEQMQYTYKPEDRDRVREMVREHNKLLGRIKEIQKFMTLAGRDHYRAFAASV